jgi:hypothetical protein
MQWWLIFIAVCFGPVVALVIPAVQIARSERRSS